MAFLTEILTWQNLGTLFNSGFTTSLVGALAGAYAGATAAQKIAERSKEREQLLAQIRGTNAAIMVAFGICNTGLAMKNQHTKSLHENFLNQRNELTEHIRKHKSGEIAPGTAFEFQADLRSLQIPLLPINVLQNHIYEKLSISGRPLALVATLAGASSSLEDTIRNRNVQIERFKRIPQNQRDSVFPAIYFGLPFGGGHVSTEYADTIDALYRLTDDVIFFSRLLCQDLENYGEEILSKYKSHIKDTEETIHSIEFDTEKTKNLLPDEKEYQDWLKGFKTKKVAGK